MRRHDAISASGTSAGLSLLVLRVTRSLRALCSHASVALAALTAASAGCTPATPPSALQPVRLVEPVPPASIRFERITAAAGLQFRHEDGGTGQKYFVEVMGPGCALFDYDGDGWLDAYLVNGGVLPGFKGGRPKNRLYRNNQDGTFSEVTARAGVEGTGYGIGCCAGDYDNDGHTDLYVTQFGAANVLYRNNGDGTFTDVTRPAGVTAGGFSSGAAFGDYDADGDLDLYVARYVEYDPLTSPRCSGRLDGQPQPIYCMPTAYEGASGILYRNEGDGRFHDVTKAAGMAVSPGRSLGCRWVDLDADGALDLYVANDMSENFLFRNLGGGKFRETAFEAGAAVSSSGRSQAGMGVAAGDCDGDGRFDLFVTNFTGEYTALYHNDGAGFFQETSATAGLIEPTRSGTGFGVALEDLDLDGWPDLFIVNGHVTEDVERFYTGVSLAQPNVVLRNRQGAGFEPVADPGPEVLTPRVHRGLAVGDIDNDGRIDALVSNWRGEPDLFRNTGELPHHYLTLKLRGTRSNRDAIGARVTVTAGGREQVREVASGGSYCSQGDFRLTFGLGLHETADRVVVRWPNGRTEARTRLQGDRIVTWTEGEAEEVRQ
ncbi:MAG: CRTAC1 family protein [Armatimonadota bacterium]